MRARKRFFRRLGHHGVLLLALGVFDEVYAVGIPGSAAANSATSHWLSYLAPLDYWAGLWAAVGVILICGAFARRDWWAFGTAMGLKIAWSMLYLFGWLLHGVGRGWVGAATWTLLAIVVYTAASRPEKQWPGA